jgi:hypothetical protein
LRRRRIPLLWLLLRVLLRRLLWILLRLLGVIARLLLRVLGRRGILGTGEKTDAEGEADKSESHGCMRAQSSAIVSPMQIGIDHAAARATSGH